MYVCIYVSMYACLMLRMYLCYMDCLSHCLYKIDQFSCIRFCFVAILNTIVICLFYFCMLICLVYMD